MAQSDRPERIYANIGHGNTLYASITYAICEYQIWRRAVYQILYAITGHGVGRYIRYYMRVPDMA
eukprot:2155905-Rhodomonas_salina.1